MIFTQFEYTSASTAVKLVAWLRSVWKNSKYTSDQHKISTGRRMREKSSDAWLGLYNVFVLYRLESLIAYELHLFTSSVGKFFIR